MTTSTGASSSGYGFTGEYQQDGLVYLRARHYAPGMGRFLTRDTWPGEVNRPLSLNRWAYVEANPVNFVDPTGHIKEEKDQIEKADLIVAKLHKIYNVRVQKDWGYTTYIFPVPSHISSDGTISRYFVTECIWKEGNWRNAKELQLTLDAVKDMSNKLGGSDRFIAAMKYRPVEVVRYKGSKHGGYAYAPPINYILGDVALYDNTFSLHAGDPNVTDSQRDIFAKYVVVHEMAHVWDFRNDFNLGKGLANHVNAYRLECFHRGGCHPFWDPNQPSVERHFITKYAKTNRMEFWADSFAASVYPNLWWYLRPDLTTEVKTYINGYSADLQVTFAPASTGGLNLSLRSRKSAKVDSFWQPEGLLRSTLRAAHRKWLRRKFAKNLLTILRYTLYQHENKQDSIKCSAISRLDYYD